VSNAHIGGSRQRHTAVFEADGREAARPGPRRWQAAAGSEQALALAMRLAAAPLVVENSVSLHGLC